MSVTELMASQNAIANAPKIPLPKGGIGASALSLTYAPTISDT